MENLTADQVAQAMLDMYQTEADWCPRGLFTSKNGKEVYCLLGARAVIQSGGLGIWNTDKILNHFADDEYLLRLASVIREQYPQLREKFDPSKNLWDQLNVIFVFNDLCGFEDIRLVIEKAAAR